MTGIQRRLGRLQTARAVGIGLVAANAASLAVDLATAPVMAFLPVTLIVVLLLLIGLESRMIGGLRAKARTAQASRAEGGFRVPPGTVFVHPEVGLPPGFVPPSAALGTVGPRTAWDVSTTLDRCGYNGLWHYEDARQKPGGGEDGIIRVIPRSADRLPWSPGVPVITSWTVIVRVADPLEGTDLLEQAGPLLRDLMSAITDLSSRPRYFRLEDGRLAEVPGGMPARLVPCKADDGSTDAFRVVTQSDGRLAVCSDRTQSEVPPPDWRPMRRAPEPAVAQPDSGAVRLDPRWEWRLVQAFGMPDRYVKVRCLHTEVVPVESAADKDKVVAQLCLTCDTQFPAPRED